MESVQIYNLPTGYVDNTYEGVQFVLPTGASYNLTNATVSLFVNTTGGTVKEYKSPDELLITLNYTITLPPHIIEIPAGKYEWRLKITFADGRKKTYIKGTWEIKAY